MTAAKLLPIAGLAVLVAIVFVELSLRARRQRRLRHLRVAPLPPGIYDKLRIRRPDIDPVHFPRIERALRDFFEAYLLSGRKPVSMPSQAADELWHEFILYTRQYQQFCNAAFGRFLHHAPATVLSGQYDRNVGLRRVWWYCCKRESIDPRKAARLPLLFALDTQLALADGFHYALDCNGLRKQKDDGASGGCGGGIQCTTDMSDTSFDGTTDGLGDSDGGGGGGGGDSGGDGGSSDGGGGCGGGGD
jgi:hypothetical protein